MKSIMRPKGELPTLKLLIALVIMIVFVSLLLLAYIQWRVPVWERLGEYNQTAKKFIDIFGY